MNVTVFLDPKVAFALRSFIPQPSKHVLFLEGCTKTATTHSVQAGASRDVAAFAEQASKPQA
jgi:hypothetical protein